jgi:glycosyltransferase involved in cell wall biosynthesis
VPLRLDLLSPLPPVRSGISDYTMDLLPRLAELADVRLLRIEEQPVSAEILRRWAPVDAERVGEGGRLPLYQMGNNSYHDRVLDLALRTPGALVLHDVVLHHRWLEATVAKHDWAGYQRVVEREEGALGAATARGWRWGSYGRAAQFALPLHRTLLAAQRGVLVHSRWAAELLREEQHGVGVEVIPMAVPLPPAPTAAARQASRRRLGLGEGTRVLGSFGFQSPIKRTDIAVRALARPELAGVRLVVAGEVADTYDLETLASQLGVRDRVDLLGYLPFEELEAAVLACDLSVNLRYPSAGETSASLLRVLALGCPALVSDYAQFRDLPEDLAPRVPVGDGEVERLAAVAGALLAVPERLAELGARARRYVAQEHDPQRAAKAVVAACREIAARSVPEMRHSSRATNDRTTGQTSGQTSEQTSEQTSDRTSGRTGELTSLTASRLPGELRIEGLDGWRPGERRTIRLQITNLGSATWRAAHRPGGIAIEVQLRGGAAEEPAAQLPWQPLPVDLAPGASHSFAIALRRPLGAARLRVEPRALGRERLATLGGPSWEGEV